VLGIVSPLAVVSINEEDRDGEISAALLHHRALPFPNDPMVRRQRDRPTWR
jgi:hypothetical protein